MGVMLVIRPRYQQLVAGRHKTGRQMTAPFSITCRCVTQFRKLELILKPSLPQGSVLAVSHDRYFLRQIATRVVAVSMLCLQHADAIQRGISPLDYPKANFAPSGIAWSGHTLVMMRFWNNSQVEGAKLRDYEGNYDEFLEKNDDEAEVHACWPAVVV